MRTLSIVLIAVVLPTFLIMVPASEPTKTANILVDVSGTLINSLVQRSIDRTDAVNERILDTPVEGKSRTIAAVRADLVPSPNVGIVDVVFNGHIYARSTSIRPFVLIHTITTSKVGVRRRVMIDGRGFRHGAGPSCADSHSTLLDVTCRKEYDALALRFGRQLFDQNAAEGDFETAQKTAARIQRELAMEIAPQLDRASKAVAEGIQGFTKAGLRYEGACYKTTATHLQAGVRFAGPKISAPPPNFADGVDLGIRVHQSLVTELTRAELGGKAFSLDKIDTLYGDVTRGLLLEGRKGVEKEDSLKKLAKALSLLGAKSTTIVLAKDDPLTATFADGGFTVDIHIATIRDENVDHEGMRVRGAYRFENTPTGIFANRKGPIQYAPATPLPGKKLEPQTEALKLVREVLFAEIVKERLLVNIPTPDSFGQARLQAPGADARNGWLALAWKRR